jgi:glycosyltransferase involved in cell wall biosynthesis
MKILYFNPYLLSSDGSGLHSREFVRFAEQEAVEIVTYPVGNIGEVNGSAKSLFGIKRESAPGLFAVLALMRGSFRSFSTFSHLYKIIREFKPDVIYQRLHPFDWSARWLQLVSHLPLVIELNSSAGLETGRIWGKKGSWIYDFHEKVCLRKADGIIVVSSALAKIVQEVGIPSEWILINPNGVDLSLFTYSPSERSAIREQLGISENGFVIGFSGSLKPWHGVDNLLEAFPKIAEKLPESYLLIIGEAGKKANDRKEGIIFSGKVPHNEMPKYLSACDVCVAPYPKLDPFYFSPIKVIEYMAMQIPVVASDQGQLHELLNQNRGVLYDSENNNNLVEALLWVHENSDESEKSAGKAREYVEQNLTWKGNITRTLEFLQKTLANRNDK